MSESHHEGAKKEGAARRESAHEDAARDGSARDEASRATASCDESTPLRLFLSGRDEVCPACGYNLRGVESAACPECGQGLRLALSRADAPSLEFGGYRLLLLMGFGWTALAGIMNATRTVELARSLAKYGAWSVRNPPPSGVGFARGTPWAMNWNMVDWLTWFRLGWAVFLAVAGIVGLVFLARYWSGRCPAKVRRRLVHACMFVFSVYVVWHVVWFMQEYLVP